MGPVEIKKNIYNVMTSSRELTNYCQESVKSFQSKTISDALNNYHLKSSIDFITNSLTDQGKNLSEFNKIDFYSHIGSEDKQAHNKVIDYMETYLMESKL